MLMSGSSLKILFFTPFSVTDGQTTPSNPAPWIVFSSSGPSSSLSCVLTIGLRILSHANARNRNLLVSFESYVSLSLIMNRRSVCFYTDCHTTKFQRFDFYDQTILSTRKSLIVSTFEVTMAFHHYSSNCRIGWAVVGFFFVLVNFIAFRTDHHISRCSLAHQPWSKFFLAQKTGLFEQADESLARFFWSNWIVESLMRDHWVD